MDKHNPANKYNRGLKWSILLNIVLGLFGAVGWIFAVTPEVRQELAYKTYEKTHIDSPDLSIDQLQIDGMDGKFIEGCPGGSYQNIDHLYSQNEPLGSSFQRQMYLGPDHTITFYIRNKNTISNSEVRIENIYLQPLDWRGPEETLAEMVVQGECGGGETDKIFTLSNEILKRGNDVKSLAPIRLDVSTSNKEAFDHLVLTSDDTSDPIIIEIPFKNIYGILKFRIDMTVEYKGEIKTISSPDLFIANDKYSETEQDLKL